MPKHRALNVAKLWIRIMWLYRDCGDSQMERYAAKKAISSYVYVVELNNKSAEKPDEIQQIYVLLGELNLNLKDIPSAKKYFEMSLAYREVKDLTRQAENRLELING